MAISDLCLCVKYRSGPLTACTILACQVQERASNRLYYLSAKMVQAVRGPLLYLTKQEFS